MEFTSLAGELQQHLQGEVKINEPLTRYTTWRIGGPADLLYQPRDREELVFCLDFARKKGVPLHVMGNGSNILVLDSGLRGLVIRTRKWNLVEAGGYSLWAAAGSTINQLLKVSIEHGLGGLEFAAGIPATIGGAVVNNAGTLDGSMGDIVQGVEIITGSNGSLKYLSSQDISFAYRWSSLRNMGTVVAVELQLIPVEPEIVSEKVATNLRTRHERQPLEWPNSGSVFKNPPGYYAGRLIEEIGAKGWRVGQAEVSAKHANFIINRGKATANDVLELIAKIQETVTLRFGINLELEIEIWGEGL